MRRVCLNCQRHFEALSDRAEYCSGRCRAEASRRRRDRALLAALDEAERAINKIRNLNRSCERGGNTGG